MEAPMPQGMEAAAAEEAAGEFRALASDLTKRFPADQQYAQGHMKHHDVCWAIVFVAHLLAMASAAGFLYPQLHMDPSPGQPKPEVFTSGAGLSYFAVALSVGAAAVLLWLVAVRYIARQLMWVAAAAVLAGIIYFSVQAVRWHLTEVAIAGGILAVLWILVLVSAGKRIGFTARVTETSVQVISKHPGTWLLSLAGVVPVFVWCCVSLMVVVVSSQASRTIGGGACLACIICAVLSLYWTYNVVHSVQHTTVAGVVARWYFTPSAEALHMPTWVAFRQSILYNFGAICLGSLLAAIVQTVKGIIRFARGGVAGNPVQNCCCCCLGCVVELLDWVLEFINTYAFVYLAIYPSKFTTAAKNAMRLVKATGFDQLYHYNLTGMLMLLGQILCATIAGLSAKYCTDAKVFGAVAPNIASQLAFASAAIIFFVTGIACSPVQSGVLALIVSFAQDPAALKASHPLCYDKFRNVATDMNLPMAGTHFTHSAEVVRRATGDAAAARQFDAAAARALEEGEPRASRSPSGQDGGARRTGDMGSIA